MSSPSRFRPLVLAALVAVGIAAACACAGSAVQSARVSRVGRALTTLMVGPPPLGDPAPDLVGREPPSADCAAIPFMATVSLDSEASEALPLLFRADCATEAREVGDIRPGAPREISLPGAGRLSLAWVDARCGDDPQDPTGCDVDPERPAATLVVTARDPVVVRLLDATGEPVAGAGVGFRGWPGRRRTDLEGEAVFSWGVRGLRSRRGSSVRPFRVTLGGVARRVRRLATEGGVVTLQLYGSGVFHEGRVVDPDGQQVAGASVRCDTQGGAAGVVTAMASGDFADLAGAYAVTDPAGRFGCEFSSLRAPRNLTVDAAGHPRRTFEVEAGEQPPDPLVLARARVVRVGCAGLTGDRCDSITGSLRCRIEGDAWRPQFGSCDRLEGRGGTVEHRCVCPPEAQGLQGGGVTTRLGIGNTAWLDFRPFAGELLVDFPEDHDACELQAVGPNGLNARSIRTDHGQVRLMGLQPGPWELRGACGDRAWSRQIQVLDQPVHVRW